MNEATRCPCLSGLTYDVCCGPLHAGVARARTAEQLMRSRYSAFATGDPAYLLATWHPTTRPKDLELDETIRWYRLDIVATTAGTPFDTSGTVEFEAFRKGPGGAGSQHEVSSFVREDGQWFYVDGHR
ncbi:YchJ family protein [Aeromicrobium sp. CF3.5]|uniref:YchJ family protein n=1 Tax=Aeromicrobium sp. CF3.5 TaxID=3373078 RepID=UPI003EE4C8F1